MLGEGDKLTKRTPKEIDDLDLQIVTLLQNNSRLSFRQIAQRLGVTKATVFNRTKNMETIGALRAYTVSLDPLKWGLDCTALVQIQAQGGYLGELEEELARNANVIAAYDTAGEYAVAAIVKYKGVSQLHEFVEKLSVLPFVKRAVVIMAVATIKEDYRISLPSGELGGRGRDSVGIDSCRDCANFEDRRDMERVAICAMHHGPSVCCPEFKPSGREKDSRKLYDMFCLKCSNFETVGGVALCARDHRPGVACAAFRNKYDAVKLTT